MPTAPFQGPRGWDQVTVIAVVPSYNEEDLIGETVRSLEDIADLDGILVVDDASSDGTCRSALAEGCRVVVNGKNLGKGASLNRVLAHLDFDYLLLVDGDLGAHAFEAKALLDPVISGEADLCIASFGPPALKGGLGLAKGLGRSGIALNTGRLMRSPLSGQRAMTRDAYRACAPFSSGFGVEVGMTIDALRAGFRVLEVDTDMSHRETGRDLAGFLHRGRQFADIVLALASRMPRARRRLCWH